MIDFGIGFLIFPLVFDMFWGSAAGLRGIVVNNQSLSKNEESESSTGSYTPGGGEAPGRI